MVEAPVRWGWNGLASSSDAGLFAQGLILTVLVLVLVGLMMLVLR